MAFNIGNLLAFQALWFGCILGAANEAAWLGLALAALWLPLHLALTPCSRVAEALLIGGGALLGLVLDSVQVAAGFLDFGNPQATLQLGLLPAWMPALWGGLAATLCHSLGWLRGRPLIACCAGIISAPLAYNGAQQLGAVRLSNPEASVAVAVSYALALPLLAYAASLIKLRPAPVSPRAPVSHGEKA